MNVDHKESIWETLLIIFSGFDGWFCVLSGFFDETEKQQGERLTGVGGFLFRKEELDAVQKKLASLGKPRSASQLRHYGNLQKLNDIARITAEHRGEGFVCTVRDDDFDSLKSLNPHAANMLGTSYGICLIHIVDIVRQYLIGIRSSEDVLYTIEAGAKGQKQGENFLNRIRDDTDLRSYWHLRNVRFIPKDHPNDGLILRSADLLIYEWQRNYREMETAEQNNAADSGWTEPFRLLFKDQESPAIRHYRITKNDLRTSTLWIALQGLNANPKI